MPRVGLTPAADPTPKHSVPPTGSPLGSRSRGPAPRSTASGPSAPPRGRRARSRPPARGPPSPLSPSRLRAAGLTSPCGPSALVENTILFPLGPAGIRSAAASPLPGHLIADTGQAGHLIAVGLLVAAGAAIAISLVARPPRTVPSAVWRLAIGLSLMFMLTPATRFGHFIFPTAPLPWPGVVQARRPHPPHPL